MKVESRQTNRLCEVSIYRPPIADHQNPSSLEEVRAEATSLCTQCFVGHGHAHLFVCHLWALLCCPDRFQELLQR